METEQITPTEFIYPTLVRRVQSIFLDTAVILTSMFLISGILSNFEQTPDWLRGALFFGLWGVYEPLGMTLGGTIGNRIMRLRVIKNNTHKDHINLFQAYIRFAVKLLLGWISFLTIHTNREKRAIHDFAAGSVMIQITKAQKIHTYKNNPVAYDRYM
jgi:uncharacterized RDD family membrane protein YckC